MSDIESGSEGTGSGSEEEVQSAVEDEIPVVVVEEVPADLPESNYQMKPGLHDAFQVGIIKDIIRTVLQEVLQGKNYSQTEVPNWTKKIADEINIRVKDLAMRRYKHVVQVMLLQQASAGSRYIARCRWDAECDSQISDYFINANIVCVVSVFGIYFY